MKKLLLFLFLISNTLLVHTVKASGGDSDYEASEEATHLPAIILVNDEEVSETVDYLKSLGVVVLYYRENMLLSFIPYSFFDDEETDSDENEDEEESVVPLQFRKIKSIKKIEISRPRGNVPTMDVARFFNNSEKISLGENLPMPYTGKGVIVGICDTGIDTRHPNFLTMDGEECRIRRAVHYEEQSGNRTVYSTPEEIYDWWTDNPDDWHATHVAGIAAGAHKESNYYSLAPDADIVFTGSQLSDVGLLAGVEDIIAYAREVNRPAVINLSMGNYLGPHDGTSLFTRYLDLCSEDAIICLSAGNSGKQDSEPVSMSFDFSENKTYMDVRTNDWAGTDSSGEAEIWSIDKNPFLFNFYWRSSTSEAKSLRVYDSVDFSEDNVTEWRISADIDDPDYDETFASHFTEGYVKATGGISSLNGRFYVNLQYRLKTEELHGTDAWAEYWPAMRISASPGSHVDIFCSGGSFLRQERNGPVIDNNFNISDLATGHNTISVGMLCNRTYESSGKIAGEPEVHSSYATLHDGRKLPLTCAPGADVISSISSAYLNKYPEKINGTVDYHDGEARWAYNTGTSMSCPYVVSVIATWLQAYPQLAYSDVQKIIKQTNIREPESELNTRADNELQDPRYGQGILSPYEGAKEVIKYNLGVGTTENLESVIRVVNGYLCIANPMEENLSIDIYTPSGLHEESMSFCESIGAVPLFHLPSGIHIIRVSSSSDVKSTLKIAL